MKTIVILDDDRGHLSVLSMLSFIYSDNFTTFATTDYNEVKKFFDTFEVDLFLTDYYIDDVKGINGEDLCDLLVSKNFLAKCIIVSADETLKDKCKYTFVEKPITTENFIEKLKEFLE